MKKHVLAICGSTRGQSSNLYLIKAIENLAVAEMTFSMYPSIADLPHYDPDADIDPAPAPVIRLRKSLSEADGVLICTPEYAMGLPGSMKNLLDWTVTSSDFSNKPVLAITASSSGKKAHASLLDTLTIIEAKVAETELLISFIKSKITDQYKISDAQTLHVVKQKLNLFNLRMKNSF